MKYQILQLKAKSDIEENGKKDYFFRDLDKARASAFNQNDYECVETVDMPSYPPVKEEEVMGYLDILYDRYNLFPPADYHGRSVSVSDIIILDGVYYYVQPTGFTKLTPADLEMFLKGE